MKLLLSIAVAIVILAAALLPLLTPLWMHPALTAAGSLAPTGGGQAALDASDQTVRALVALGSFDFAAADGSQMFSAAEQAHMHDASVVLFLFLGVAVAALIFTVIALRAGHGATDRWAAVARGAIGLVVAVVVVGLFAALAFDTAFTLFHEIFFPGGNWAFSPDSNLIRLYPEPFWEMTAAALAVLAIVFGLLVWVYARRRAGPRFPAAYATA